MVFDPTEFLAFSERLVRQRTMTAVDIRNSVSRAYCATFLYTRERMVSRQLFTSTRTADDHGLLIQLLRRQPNGDAVAVGEALDLLRVSRNNADYNLRWSGTASHAVLAALQARAIVTDVDRLYP
jgi:hypothetical protein